MKKKFLFGCVFIFCALFLSACSNNDISFNALGVYSYDDSARYAAAESAGDSYGATVSSVTEIDIEWVQGEVNITASDTASDVTFSETADYKGKDEMIMRYFLDGTTLKIRFAESGVNLSLSPYKNIKKTLFVTLPAAAMAEIDVDSVSADVTVSSVKASEISLDAVSGKITAKNSEATEAKFATVSGNITVSDCSFIGSTEINSVSGEATVNNCSVSNFEAETVSGNVNFQTNSLSGNAKIETVSGNIAVLLPTEISGFRASFSTTSGEFSSSSPVTVSGKTHAYGDAPSFALSCSTVSGNFSVNLQ